MKNWPGSIFPPLLYSILLISSCYLTEKDSFGVEEGSIADDIKKTVKGVGQLQGERQKIIQRGKEAARAYWLCDSRCSNYSEVAEQYRQAMMNVALVQHQSARLLDNLKSYQGDIYSQKYCYEQFKSWSQCQSNFPQGIFGLMQACEAEYLAFEKCWKPVSFITEQYPIPKRVLENSKTIQLAISKYGVKGIEQFSEDVLKIIYYQLFRYGDDFSEFIYKQAYEKIANGYEGPGIDKNTDFAWLGDSKFWKKLAETEIEHRIKRDGISEHRVPINMVRTDGTGVYPSLENALVAQAGYEVLLCRYENGVELKYWFDKVPEVDLGKLGIDRKPIGILHSFEQARTNCPPVPVDEVVLKGNKYFQYKERARLAELERKHGYPLAKETIEDLYEFLSKKTINIDELLKDDTSEAYAVYKPAIEQNVRVIDCRYKSVTGSLKHYAFLDKEIPRTEIADTYYFGNWRIGVVAEECPKYHLEAELLNRDHFVKVEEFRKETWEVRRNAEFRKKAEAGELPAEVINSTRGQAILNRPVKTPETIQKEPTNPASGGVDMNKKSTDNELVKQTKEPIFVSSRNQNTSEKRDYESLTVINNPDIVYPRDWYKKIDRNGTIKVKLQIDSSGQVSFAKCIRVRTVNSEKLCLFAKRHSKKLRFKPPEMSGNITSINTEYTFLLNNDTWHKYVSRAKLQKQSIIRTKSIMKDLIKADKQKKAEHIKTFKQINKIKDSVLECIYAVDGSVVGKLRYWHKKIPVGDDVIEALPVNRQFATLKKPPVDKCPLVFEG